MASNVAKGSYYKARTKKWLIERGYAVGNMEEIYWIYSRPTKPGEAARMLPRKKDQFGSDLIAVCGSHVVFVQCKGGEAASGGTFPAARREFAKFVWPDTPLVKRWVIGWSPRSRQPRVIEVFGAQSESFLELEQES